MTTVEIWTALQKESPDPYQAVDVVLEEPVAEDWPYVALALGSGKKWVPDALVSAVARGLAGRYVPDRDAAAALRLVIAPYPKDHTALLNLLSLAHSIAAKPGDAALARVAGRALALLVRHGLRHPAPLISIGASNVLGGIRDGALVFASEGDRKAMFMELDAALTSVPNAELKSFIRKRAEVTLTNAVIGSIGAILVNRFHASLKLQLANVATPETERFSNHTEAALRAFAESQADGGCLGSASVYIEPDGEATSVAGDAIQAIGNAIAEMIRNASWGPTALVTGSVEVVLRFDATAPGEPNLADVAERITSISAPTSAEILPAMFAKLIERMDEDKFSISGVLWSSNGDAREFSIDLKRARKIVDGVGHRMEAEKVVSIDVPQADELWRVFLVAERLAAGEKITTKAISKPDEKELDQRQVAYYKHGARILGLATPVFTVTTAGRLISEIGDESERVRRATLLFELSAVGRAWMLWSKVTSATALNPTTARQFLTERADLSGDTIARRATTLSEWVKAFQITAKKP